VADKRISELDLAASLADTDEFAINKGGVSKRLLASQLTTIPVCPCAVTITIEGVHASDPTPHVHFEMQLDTNSGFAAPVVDVASEAIQTYWKYFNGSTFVAVPAGGVAAGWEWLEDVYGQMYEKAVSYSDKTVVYEVPSGLSSGLIYYGRIREVCVETGLPGDWRSFVVNTTVGG